MIASEYFFIINFGGLQLELSLMIEFIFHRCMGVWYIISFDLDSGRNKMNAVGVYIRYALE